MRLKKRFRKFKMVPFGNTGIDYRIDCDLKFIRFRVKSAIERLENKKQFQKL
ncbi:hypothetical protein [Chryseobacterium sp. R2A-55]|uniref:hypothetical protein n=1 Tax=Chryseobacterium sp. R2A-55 TaxID=2744445 RepID=UPI001F337BF4|nr:hypothetical protein [Chryseobacterium sp. R2A-55]